jgi:hypothetical protein
MWSVTVIVRYNAIDNPGHDSTPNLCPSYFHARLLEEASCLHKFVRNILRNQNYSTTTQLKIRYLFPNIIGTNVAQGEADRSDTLVFKTGQTDYKAAVISTFGRHYCAGSER